MKKFSVLSILASLAVIFALTLIAPRPAFAALPGGSSTTSELGISTGTAFVKLATGPGVVQLVTIGLLTSATDYVVCFDSAPATSPGYSLTDDGTASSPRIVDLLAGSTTQTSPTWPPIPVIAGYSHGLTCAKSAASGRASILHKP